MTNPEYLEAQINENLRPYGISAVWNGSEPEQDEPARFYVCYGDEDTDLQIWDHAVDTDIVRYKGNRTYTAVDCVRGFSNLAKTLAAIIAEEVASGKLGVEE